MTAAQNAPLQNMHDDDGINSPSTTTATGSAASPATASIPIASLVTPPPEDRSLSQDIEMDSTMTALAAQPTATNSPYAGSTSHGRPMTAPAPTMAASNSLSKHSTYIPISSLINTVEHTSGAIEADSPPSMASASSVTDSETHRTAPNYDEDETYGSDAGTTASTSLSSSVRDYVFENSRRYHKYQEGRYLMPNDNQEQEREDMKHAMIVAAMEGKLYLSPLNNPQKVLDIGTGTGIWVVEMGDEHPEAEITGIDLSPIQPTWVPPNVRFLVDDAEADWITPPNSLDFVHARHLCMAIKDWPKMVKQSYTALKPGGWIELQELRFEICCDDDSIPPNYAYSKFCVVAIEAFQKFNIDILEMLHNAELVRNAGFTNVEERIYKIPIGQWPKDPKLKMIGLYNRSMLYDAMQAVGLASLTRGMGWTAEQVELFLVDARKDLLDSSVHVYINFHVVCGQKPMGSEGTPK